MICHALCHCMYITTSTLIIIPKHKCHFTGENPEVQRDLLIRTLPYITHGVICSDFHGLALECHEKKAKVDSQVWLLK